MTDKAKKPSKRILEIAKDMEKRWIAENPKEKSYGFLGFMPGATIQYLDEEWEKK